MSTALPSDPNYVAANPARRFFVAMLVRDIDLLPAIIDLVDNSVDGAKRLRPPNSDDDLGDGGLAPADDSERYAGLHVNVTASASAFEIEDNCGGIDIDDARHYAFLFGRHEDFDGASDEVGQFGVGMKRALFKLGTAFEVTAMSRHSSFHLPVRVDEWMRDPSPEWSFRFDDYQENLDLEPEQTGTIIQVAPLHPTIAEEMGDPAFIGRLRQEIQLRQSKLIRQGLRIALNREPVQAFDHLLLFGPNFAPIHIESEIPTEGEGSLHMQLYAGLVRIREDDRKLDDGNAEEFRAPPEAGWYVYCNDRLLFAANRSRVTGWGDGAAAYHPQYRQFRGYVMLDGNAESMPWNTTKTSVDEESRVWRAVQTHMFDALQKSQTVMNRLKKEFASGLPDQPTNAAMTQARAVPLATLPLSRSFALPPPAKRQLANTQWIRYQVDKQDFEAVARQVDSDAAGAVGRATFDFYLANQVPD
jgi:hypothetical protein